MKTKYLIIATVCSMLCITGAQDAQAQRVYKKGSTVVMDFGIGSGFPQTAVEPTPGQKVISGYGNTTGPIAENSINEKINATIYKMLEVAPTDASSGINWADAYTACKAKGGNWRLPTQRELTQMFIFREALADLGAALLLTDLYWSATEDDTTNTIAYLIGQSGGRSVTKTHLYPARCVREIP